MASYHLFFKFAAYKKDMRISFFLRYGLFLSVFLLLSAVVYAVPAKPGQKRDLTLTDGTVVSARLVGDEYGHYWLADDGKAYRGEGDIYVEIDLKSLQENAQKQRKESDMRRVKRLNDNQPMKSPSPGITGSKKGLIILVNFSDVAFGDGHDNALFYRIANEKNFSYESFHGSMYDYFYDQSEGQFLLSFDVVGPVTLSRECSYYGENVPEENDRDSHPASMVSEAILLADSQVNYADYDWNGDGEVEQVYVVYAGMGEADSYVDNTIWPHEWQLSSAKYYYNDGNGALFIDGVRINTYACGSELNSSGNIAGIGTMCHEFSHCLGYPDYYDTDYSGGQGMGDWDIMDGGSYNGGGYIPAGYTSYERWVAGWKIPVELTDATCVSSMRALQDGGNTYVIYNKGHRDEFFLLENRQKIGWDGGLPGAGLLILHVDYDEAIWTARRPNDDPEHQRMTWIAADGEYQYQIYQGKKYYSKSGAATDPFPYNEVNAFNKNTTPAAFLYNENEDGTYYLDSSVEDITQNLDGTISFRFFGPDKSYSLPQGTGIGVNAVQELVDIWHGKEDVEVSFTRSFTQGVASTICLPFAMTTIDGGSVYQLRDITYDDNEGAWVATMNDVTPDPNLVTSTEAGVPYLFMPDATGEVTFSGMMDEVPATTGEIPLSGYDGIDGWRMSGTYTKYAWDAGEHGTMFGFASSSKVVEGNQINAGQFVKLKSGASVPAFRASLTYSGSNGVFLAPIRGESTETPDLIKVRLLDKNGSVTAVGSVNIRTGEFDKWYDLSGRRLDSAPTAPGIYINNGRKTVIK